VKAFKFVFFFFLYFFTSCFPIADHFLASRYGKSLIPFTKIDQEQLSLKFDKGLNILGFVPASKVDPQIYIGGVMSVVPTPGSQDAATAFSSMVHALYEMDRVAIARYISREGLTGVKLVVLTPHIKLHYECLYMTMLPFSEDVRLYNFASLARFKPSDKQLDAAEALINSLDLMTSAKDVDGDPLEELKPSDTPNPYIHRLQEAIKYRALHPGQTVLPPK